ncbi:MAG: hypothetical protein ABSG16_23655 [Candidatus Acidiferrum sp.]|jgi:hypothetical protein
MESQPNRTEGETLFEQYLNEMGYAYEFEKQFPGRAKRPDFSIQHDGEILCEVKDFAEAEPTLGFGAYDPYPLIRQKINQARGKFGEFKEFPCCLVLRNRGRALVHSEDPHIMLGAMYGDAGFTIPINTKTCSAVGAPQPAFLGRGKMVRPGWTEPQNTTISALITLRNYAVGMQFAGKMMKKRRDLSINETMKMIEKRFPGFDINEKTVCVIVWENAVATIPLPRDLFNGPYDERWGFDGQSQVLTFRGDKMAELLNEDLP